MGAPASRDDYLSGDRRVSTCLGAMLDVGRLLFAASLGPLMILKQRPMLQIIVSHLYGYCMGP